MKLISLLTPNRFSKVPATLSDRSSNISACVVMALFRVVDDSTQNPKDSARRNYKYIYVCVWSGRDRYAPMLTKQSASMVIT